MIFRTHLRRFVLALAYLLPFCGLVMAQSNDVQSGTQPADLQLVIMLSRHGVRSPLGTPVMNDKYAAAPWPKWDVAPGSLTPHGYELMKIFGAWDRTKFSGEGLLAPGGCSDAAHVTVVADSDQRTRESAKALMEGMLPGCGVEVHAQAEGTFDPLFRPVEAGVAHMDSAVSDAATAGRVGDDPSNLAEAYRAQLSELDRVLAGCGHGPANTHRASIFDNRGGSKAGSGPPKMSRGQIASASTMVENLLLEYTQGMSDADTGWGCVDGANLRFLMQLNGAVWEFGLRTPAIARPQASNLLAHIEKSMEQSVTGKPVQGALGRPDDRLILLLGHDSNIAAVAGSLGIDWALDGRIDDTPPGGALLFELWRSRADGRPFVRMEYTAQTLEQMRKSEALTTANPPGEAPIFVPACGRADMSCAWEGFREAMLQAIVPAYVAAQP